MPLLADGDALYCTPDPLNTPTEWKDNFGLGYQKVHVSRTNHGLRLMSPPGGVGLVATNPWYVSGDVVRMEADVRVLAGRARISHAYTSSGPWTDGYQTIAHEFTAVGQWCGIELGDEGCDVLVLGLRYWLNGIQVPTYRTLSVSEVVMHFTTGTETVWPWTERPPGAPAGFRAVPSETSVALSWDAQSTATHGYSLYRGTSWDVANATKIATIPAGETTRGDSGLASNTTYYYWLAGISEGGEGAKASTSAKTLTKPVPVLRLDASTTSAEVYFTQITFTPVVTANAHLIGPLMLQRQLPNQGWVDVATMSSGSPIPINSAIPAGNYEIGWFGASARFRVRSAGADTVYSPEISVSFSYRSRSESVSLRTAEQTQTSLFMENLFAAGARVEYNIPKATMDLATSITFHVPDSEGWYCTGIPSNPYTQWWNKGNRAQSGGGLRGPVAMHQSGGDWCYANNILQDFTPFGWRMVGYGDTPNPVWGIGCNTLLRPTLTIHYVDGYRAFVYEGGYINFG
jgi:hypothetical protein